MNIIFTVCNRKNLTNALALGKSVMQFPGNKFYLCWVDTEVIPNLPVGINFIPIQELSIPHWDKMVSDYYDFELVPACRPWFAKHLIQIHQYQDTFVFLAPTVLLLGSINDVFRIDSDIQLTPHISNPLKKSQILDDKRILNIGMFHAGSWVLHRSEESMKFLDWWSVRTIDRGKFDLCNGMCLDQLWLNFALVRTLNTSQISNEGWHFGLHSVLNKEINIDSGKYTVNNSPLISVDFAGLEEYNPIWSDYKALLLQSKNFKTLHDKYRKDLDYYKALVPSGQPGYGLLLNIKKNHLLRKSISKKIKSITEFIDKF